MKNVIPPQITPPPMTDFTFDEVLAILLGVKPKQQPETEKQKSSKKLKETN